MGRWKKNLNITFPGQASDSGNKLFLQLYLDLSATFCTRVEWHGMLQTISCGQFESPNQDRAARTVREFKTNFPLHLV